MPMLHKGLEVENSSCDIKEQISQEATERSKLWIPTMPNNLELGGELDDFGSSMRIARRWTSLCEKQAKVKKISPELLR